MEFLVYSLGAVATYLVLFKPQKEKIAFRLLFSALAISVLVFLLAVSTSLIPQVNI
ncbi:MAG: hypothetical protein QM804_02965 [Propionicimonas sp.]